MPDHDKIRHWLLNSVQLIVDNPDDVAVETVFEDQRTIFLVKVNPGTLER